MRTGTSRLERTAPPVVLLCGGLGLRQRDEADDLPKPLRPLPDGRPLLLHVLDYYRAFGSSEFILCVGYGAQAIGQTLRQAFRVRSASITSAAGWQRLEFPGARITIVDSGPEAGKCLRLLDARAHVGHRPFLFGYCDVLSDFDLRELVDLYEPGKDLVTLAATRVRSRYGELSISAEMEVTGFTEKPLQRALVSAGYFLGAPDLFDVLDPEREFEAEILPGLVARRAVRAVVHEGWWLALDTYKDFLDLGEFVEKEGLPWLKPI